MRGVGYDDTSIVKAPVRVKTATRHRNLWLMFVRIVVCSCCVLCVVLHVSAQIELIYIYLKTKSVHLKTKSVYLKKPNQLVLKPNLFILSFKTKSVYL